MPTTEDKLLAAAAHLSYLVGFPIVAPIVIYLWKRDTSPFIADHAKQAAGMHVVSLACAIAMFIVFMTGMFVSSALPVLAMVVFVAVYLVIVVWTVIAAVRVSEGKPYRYPLVGRVFDRF